MRITVVALCLTLLAWPAQAQIRTQLVVSNLSNLIAFVADPLFPGVHYAVQQNGLVFVVQNGTLLAQPFVDLRGVVTPGGGEQGLLGMAFPPDASTGRVFFNFTDSSGHTVVSRFYRSGNPLVLNPGSRFDLQWPNGERLIRQPASNHNGGHLAFGPDGFLYIGLGDGGGGDDVYRTAQNPGSLLGKMLRIDVNVPDSDTRGYQVPPDNPFLDGDPIAALGEIWDFGLRNPWRYSFDDPARGGTGALFIGDVGQGAREEVSYAPPGVEAVNFGWPVHEGNLLRNNPAEPLAYQPATAPLFDYPRSGSFPVIGTTVTGGYVYRGSALGAQYFGRYFFADYGNGRVWSVSWQPSGGGAVVTSLIEHTQELGSNGLISSFAADLVGELYVVIYSGSNSRVLKIVPANQPPPPNPPALSFQVVNRAVTLNWTAVAGALQYRLEAGTGTGLANLVQFDTGSPQTTITAADVPNGAYFVRVRAQGLGGFSAPSNEAVVSVGCSVLPAAPSNFAVNISGQNVAATWSLPANLTSVLLEVGSDAGLSNLAVFVLPATATSIAGAIPPGTYYARLRSINACGASVASTERVVTVE